MASLTTALRLRILRFSSSKIANRYLSTTRPTPKPTPSNPTPKQNTNANANANATPPPPPPLPPPLPPPKTMSTPRRLFYLTSALSLTGLSIHYYLDPIPYNTAFSDCYHSIESNIRFFSEPSRKKLLPDSQHPAPRTLIIDLDKTLVYSSFSRATGWRVAKRPGAEAFLAYMAQFYEIVVFTSNLNGYADPILDKIDPNDFISHRLYRAETHYRRGVHIKNLEPINRHLSRVILIDNNEKSVCMQRENAIIIPEWSGDAGDTALMDLTPFLESLVKEDVKDVREAIAVFKDKSVEEGLKAYRQLEGKETRAGLFGHALAGGHPPVEGQPEKEGEESKGAVWGGLGGGLFHGRPPNT